MDLTVYLSKPLSFGWRLIFNQHFAHIDQPHLIFSCFTQQNWTQKRRTVSRLLRSLNLLLQEEEQKTRQLARSKRMRLSKGAGKIIDPLKCCGQ